MNFIALCTVLLSTFTNRTTEQIPEFLVFDARPYAIDGWPLAPWLKLHPEKQKLIPAQSSACWRGCVGFWKIDGDRLVLDQLYDGGFHGTSGYGKAVSFEKLFGKPKGPIPADWFSGVIRIQTGKVLAKGEATIVPGIMSPDLHQTDVYFTISKGRVLATRRVDNQKEGASRSEEDYRWVFRSAKSVPDGGEWTDIRALARAKPPATTNDTLVTRGIVDTQEWNFSESTGYRPTDRKRDQILLNVPRTPTTDAVEVRLVCAKDIELPPDGHHVEVTGHMIESGVLTVTTIRRLKPGESFHHAAFASNP